MSATSTEEKKIEELRERRIYAGDEWREIREEARQDMLYISGNPWKQKDRDQREEAARPVIVVDEFGQYVNQVINNLRMNKRGIKVTPQGFGANDVTANFRQGKIRDIEYRSNAQQAYITMAQDAVQRSYGYLKVTAKRIGTGWNQEPVIEPIVNPDLILPDPDFLRSDGTDWKWLFDYQFRTVAEFTKEFPRATKTSFTPDDMQVPGKWYDGKRLMVAAYWEKERTSSRRKLLLKSATEGQEPFDAWEDEIPAGAKPKSDDIVNDMDVEQFKIIQRITNGFEILKTTTWPGQSVPYVGCYGKILYVDGKRVILSMVRLARDPAMLLNYIRSCQMELVGMTPKFPYFFIRGTLNQESLDLLAKSLKVPVAGIPVDPIPGAQPGQTQYPERNPYMAESVAMLDQFAESTRRAIQSAMGTGFLPTQAQRQNEKSGKALERINSSAQKGAFHFDDHFDEGVTRTGKILDEVIPAYFDTKQDTSVRDNTDKAQMVTINDPQSTPYIPVDASHQHDVSISVGPAEDSQRDAANDLISGMVSNAGFMQELGQQKGAKVLALSVRAMNGGQWMDAIAEIIDPPQKEGQPDPAQLQQQMQQMGQENQQLKGAVSKLSMEISTKKADLDSKERIAAADRETTANTADKDRAARIEIARISAAKQAADAAAEAAEEKIALGMQIAADAAKQDKAQAHELGLAHVEAATSAAAADQANQHALEQGAQPPPVDLNAAPETGAPA